MDQSSGASRRPLFIALGAIAVIVIVALVVVFSRSGPQALDPSTPEGTVQRYIQAILDDDDPAARDMLTAEHRDDCEELEPYGREGTRVTLGGTTERGDTATVDVVVTQVDGSPLGGGEYSSDERFHLEREAGAWAIAGTPWNFSLCEGTAR